MYARVFHNSFRVKELMYQAEQLFGARATNRKHYRSLLFVLFHVAAFEYAFATETPPRCLLFLIYRLYLLDCLFLAASDVDDLWLDGGSLPAPPVFAFVRAQTDLDVHLLVRLPLDNGAHRKATKDSDSSRRMQLFVRTKATVVLLADFVVFFQ